MTNLRQRQHQVLFIELDQKINNITTTVVSIEFSPLSTVELTTYWYQLHNGDYQVIFKKIGSYSPVKVQHCGNIFDIFGHVHHVKVRCCQFFGHVHKFCAYSFGHLDSVM